MEHNESRKLSALRGKLIALSASKKKLERAYTSRLIAHLKSLEQKEAYTPKRSRQNSDRGIIFNICKVLKKIDYREPNNPIKNGIQS